MTAYSIIGPKLYTESGLTTDKNLTIANGKIEAIDTTKTKKSFEFQSDYIVIPGMIDMHIHGSAGADVMDATPEALQAICNSIAKVGTTAFLATTMSEPTSRIEAALSNIAKHKNTHGAEILGCHLEGPFIAKSYKGAQDGDQLITPNHALFKQWQTLSQNAIKLVTLAPELENALPFIEYLASVGVIASVGHSNASFEQTNAAIQAGCSHATHLFNAMGKLHHRDPSTAGALLLNNNVMAELIADNHHLHPALLDLTYRIKGSEKTVLVTDATRAQCMPEGSYTLGGQTVFMKDNQVRLENGTLAGSVVTQMQAAKNMRSAVDCDIPALINMTATNPAKALNVFDRKGSIDIGKDADLLVLSPKLDLVISICRGQITYPAASDNTANLTDNF